MHLRNEEYLSALSAAAAIIGKASVRGARVTGVAVRPIQGGVGVRVSTEEPTSMEFITFSTIIRCAKVETDAGS